MDLNEYVLHANYLREVSRSHRAAGNLETATDLMEAAANIKELIGIIKGFEEEKRKAEKAGNNV